MARLLFSRTYQPTKDGKDPMIFRIKTMLQDEGLIDKLELVGELANVHPATIDNWFNGDTISPIQRTTGSVIKAIGYDIQIVKSKDIDIEKERKLAAAWLLRHDNTISKRTRESARKRVNGRPK